MISYAATQIDLSSVKATLYRAAGGRHPLATPKDAQVRLAWPAISSLLGMYTGKFNPAQARQLADAQTAAEPTKKAVA